MDVVALHGNYELDDNPGRVDGDALWAFVSTEAYWGRWRSRADVDQQLSGAWRVVGCYDQDGQMVGFARAVSDGLDLAYLSDVYVLADHRGQGLGEALVREMIDNGPGADFRWMLHTSDAHELYRKFGFSEPDRRFMERASRKAAAP
jgi:ribosomal protein S18 acetylase RimI-like enzyme